MLHLHSQCLFIHLYPAESPVKEPYHENGVWPGSPRGSFMTLLSLHRCHAAFSTITSTLAWVDQSPVSQHVL